MHLFRRLRPYRWLRLKYLIGVRNRAKDASWEYTQSLLVSIGNMTIMWAGIELMMDNLIEWYQTRVGTVIRSDLPRMLTNKLDYIRKMEPDIRWTVEERETLHEIRLEIARLSEFRHNLIHGLLHQKNSRTLDWHVHILKLNGNTVIRRNLTYSDAEIRKNVRAIFELSHKISPFFAQVIGLPHPSNS